MKKTLDYRLFIYGVDVTEKVLKEKKPVKKRTTQEMDNKLIEQKKREEEKAKALYEANLLLKFMSQAWDEGINVENKVGEKICKEKK